MALPLDGQEQRGERKTADAGYHADRTVLRWNPQEKPADGDSILPSGVQQGSVKPRIILCAEGVRASMKHLNKLRRWEHDVCFHLLYYLVEMIGDWKNIKNYYIIYIEDEGR